MTAAPPEETARTATATAAPPAAQPDRTAHLLAEAERQADDFATRAGDHDRDASFPFENFEALHAAGLLNITVPRELGGDEVGLATLCRVVSTISRGDPSTALVAAMHYLQHANIPKNPNWPRDLHHRLVRESLSGLALLNAARVEPELGTPARGGLPATTARRTDGGWRISGHKIYTTGAPILRYAVVWARTDEDPVRVGSFLVPMSAPGVRVEKTWDHLGMRATGSDDLILEDVEVPADHAVDVRPPEAWRGKDPQSGHQGTLVISAVYSGVAVAARNWLVRYLNERVPTNLGAPLATVPRIQSVVGEIESLLLVNDRLLFGLAEDFETGRRQPSGVEPGLVKTVVTNNVVRATKLALELVGNPGLSRNNPLERHYRDALCGPVHTPQDDTVLLTAGKAALGVRP